MRLKYIYPVLSLVLWVIIWELFVGFMGEPSVYPSVFLIFQNTLKLLIDRSFITDHLLKSFGRLTVATTIALPAAYGFALLCAKNKFLESFITTFVSVSFPLPKIALLPLFLLLFGIGDGTKIVLITISVFYLVFLNTFEGVRRLTVSEYIDVVRVYKIRGLNYWYQFLVKGSFRDFLVGLRSGLGYGLTMVVVSEYSLSNNGIGYFIWSSWDQFRVLDMYSGIFILAILGYFINRICSHFIVKSKA